jgi:hypothetical protein
VATGNQNGAVNRRHIGPVGTIARIVLGFAMLGYGALGGRIVLIHGRPQFGWDWAALALGLVGFPVVLLALQRIRMNRNPTRFEETGPTATTLNILVFAVLVSAVKVPAIAFIGYAALIFYGASMLLAAARGYSGCEVLAVSNWLLRRDDQVGCLVLSPLDNIEKRREQGSGSPGPGLAG